MTKDCICPDCYVELDEDDGEMCAGCTYLGCTAEHGECFE